MKGRALLDTHVLLWWRGDPSRLSHRQRDRIDGTSPDNPLWVSDISLWVIATLQSLRRIDLALPLRDWLESATAPPLVRRCGISPAVAAEVATLPDSFHRDPADRILVASTKVLGATLLTQDHRIVESDLVPVIR